jgi:hypothetical protein
MKVTLNALIKGAGHFVGEIDGKTFNTGSVFIEEPFDSSKPNYKGFRTVEYKCENSEVVKPLMHLPFPFDAVVDMEISATKSGSVIIVKSIKPIEAKSTEGKRA